MARRLLATLRRLWPSLSGFFRPTKLFEEQTVAGYSCTDWYPTVVGETFLDQYEVLAKIGWGQTATVWLCKDLEADSFKVLKMCIHERGQASWEEKAYDAMRGVRTDNIGVRSLRLHQDEFDVTGPSGHTHHAFVFAPAACNISQVMRATGRLDLPMVKLIMRHMLHALDFLHNDVNCVHTDIKANNILLRLDGHSVIEDFVQSLEKTPSRSTGSRKKGNLVYRSYYFTDLGRSGWGAPMLSDLGEARLLGEKGYLDPLPMGPVAYRAPENVLDMTWNCQVDIWQAAYGAGEWSTASHLAQMVALMGPPPTDFMRRSKACAMYFDEDGSWSANAELQMPTSLEQKLSRVESNDREAMVDFIRKMLQWRPEDRSTAKQLLQHRFLQESGVRPSTSTSDRG